MRNLFIFPFVLLLIFHCTSVRLFDEHKLQDSDISKTRFEVSIDSNFRELSKKRIIQYLPPLLEEYNSKDPNDPRTKVNLSINYFDSDLKTSLDSKEEAKLLNLHIKYSLKELRGENYSLKERQEEELYDLGFIVTRTKVNYEYRGHLLLQFFSWMTLTIYPLFYDYKYITIDIKLDDRNDSLEYLAKQSSCFSIIWVTCGILGYKPNVTVSKTIREKLILPTLKDAYAKHTLK
ncbi:MAG: hypothetical protein SFU98_20275 [Leptospiraceae bacterium]|nr:hypothetical protein [Leptospiraceae bacterium]